MREEVTDRPDPADAQAIVDHLMEYNFGRVGHRYAYTPLGVTIRDDDGTLLGGITGETGNGWLYVDCLWVAEAARGRDLGTRLMDLAEAEGRRRGCHSAYLYTYSFQARPFYEKRGYAVAATLPDFPTGHQRHYLTKRLG
ncbi:MAG TPA: GNAT family N-acetyltransferase [Alphaproteobacteria bacterium]|nr:GNAT family N-acetyltransferase [Alphaproteobacteria bacterium]